MSSSIKAISDLFEGDSESRERTDQISDLISRVLKEDKDDEFELEAILEGHPGKGRQNITMPQFQNLIGFLRKASLSESKGEQVYMNIQPHSGGTTKAKNIRVSIKGDSAVSRYCKTDDIPEDATFIEKTFVSSKRKGGERKRDTVSDINLGYRINLKREVSLDRSEFTIREVLRSWSRSLKTFRVIQRETFIVGMFKVDCSRVRQANGRTFEESGVLDAHNRYEIEIELDKANITPGLTSENIKQKLFKLIMRFLQIIRSSWFLIKDSEQKYVLEQYSKLTGQTYSARSPRLPSFVGPMPITLERSMISRVRSGNYTVTQKADGERAFLMIDSKGIVNLLYRTMNVESTGLIIKDERVYNSILDGEIITKRKDGSTIHPPLFLVFDCYMKQGKVITKYPLIETKESEKSRIGISHKIVAIMNTTGSYDVRWGDDKHAIRVSIKPFVYLSAAKDKEGLDKLRDEITKLYEETHPYETDGLIFTPAYEPVQGYTGEDSLLQIKGTWSSVMKWKPPEDNTIDFLLKLKKSDEVPLGEASVHEGQLFVLGDTYTDDILFELQEMNTYDLRQKVKESENQIVPFKWGTSRIQLEANKDGVIVSRSGETITDNIIVECAWDPEMDSVVDEIKGGWFIRNIRWDKTATFLRNGDPRGTMNYEQTAASVWTTAVEDPVKLTYLWDPKEVFDDESDGGGEDTRKGYFNRKGSRSNSLLARMTDFHNLVVKSTLISPKYRGLTKNQIFVDLACGQGGDIPRFQSTGASFVFGMDIEPDNILNRERGAIRRYISRRMRRGKVVPMKFAIADCGKDLFAIGDEMFAAIGDKSKELVRRTLSSITGKKIMSSRRDEYKSLTVGEGADRVTCMFAVHYLFRNLTTINTFFTNVRKLFRPVKDEKSLPCFVACCFDGDRVEDLILKEGDDTRTVSRYVKMGDVDKLAWSIRANYDIKKSQETRKESGSLGLSISVYIETINKEHDEFIVTDDELKTRAKENGLRIASKEEALRLGYSSGSGSFKDMFDDITSSDVIGNARKMLDYEKELSFLYKWFILVPDKMTGL